MLPLGQPVRGEGGCIEVYEGEGGVAHCGRLTGPMDGVVEEVGGCGVERPPMSGLVAGLAPWGMVTRVPLMDIPPTGPVWGAATYPMKLAPDCVTLTCGCGCTGAVGGGRGWP